MGAYAGGGAGGAVAGHAVEPMVLGPMERSACDVAFDDAMVAVTKTAGTADEAGIREYARSVAKTYYDEHVSDPEAFSPHGCALSDYECWDG